MVRRQAGEPAGSVNRDDSAVDGGDADANLNVLAGRAKLGDIGALDSLLRDVRRAVLRYAAAQRLSRDDAEDLAQEVCLAVVKVVPEWRETGRSMWGFVFTVARNKLTDGVRKQVRHSGLGRPVAIDGSADSCAVEVPDTDLGPEDRALAADSTRRMHRLLQMLPATQREVVLMRTVVGLSAKETAEALGLTAGSVHVLQHRAVTKLRSLYAESGPTGGAATDPGSVPSRAVQR